MDVELDRQNRSRIEALERQVEDNARHTNDAIKLLMETTAVLREIDACLTEAVRALKIADENHGERIKALESHGRWDGKFR